MIPLSLNHHGQLAKSVVPLSARAPPMPVIVTGFVAPAQ